LRREELPDTLEALAHLYAWMVDTLRETYGTHDIYRIVLRVFAEQFARSAGQIAVRANEEIGSDSLQSPDDPDATYRSKEGEAYTGFVLHATETAHPDNPLQLVVDLAVGPNNRDDSTILEDRLPIMHAKTPDLQELHTDAAYGSAANDQTLAQLKIDQVQTAIRGRIPQAPVEITALNDGGFQVRCAAGHMVESVPTRQRHKAEFQAAWCTGCPFAAACPAATRKNGSRTHYFDEATVLRQERHRRLLQLPPERQQLRANVEATMQEFKAPTRNGKLRVRRQAAATQHAFLRALMINFGRIFRHAVLARPADPVATGPGGFSRAPTRPFRHAGLNNHHARILALRLIHSLVWLFRIPRRLQCFG
jgi:Transposase DDE domain